MIDSGRARIAAAIVAVPAWAGVLSFLIVNTRATGSLARAIWLSFGYLTDWANWTVVIVLTAIALGWRRWPTPVVVGVATAAIVLVGVMYGVMGGWARLSLARLDSLARWSDVLAHVATPWGMLAVWLAALPHGGLRWRDAPRLMLFPLAYLVEMFGRGLLGGGYPYPEVDVPVVGWPAALTFAGAVTLLFLVLGLLIVATDRALSRRRPAPAMAAV